MNWKQNVWNHVEVFKETYPSPEFGNVPLDSLALAELDVKLDIIPWPGLSENLRVEAAINAAFTGIYIDERDYKEMEKLPPWEFNRLRFSVAHEIGHFVMHQEEFEKNGFKTVDEFLQWSVNLGGKKYGIEREANEFAGRLLVPPIRLKAEMAVPIAGLEKFDPNWKKNSNYRNQLAATLAPRFGVAPGTIKTRFSREGLWPDPEREWDN